MRSDEIGMEVEDLSDTELDVPFGKDLRLPKGHI
jgi:hypothetical protein